MPFSIPPVICDMNPRVAPIKGRSKSPCVKDWPNITSTVEHWLEENRGDLQFDDEGFDRYGIVLDADMVVVDIDCHDGQANGFQSLHEIEEVGGPDIHSKCSLIVESPSGGIHLYFRKDPDLQIPKCSSVFPAIDLLTKGSQVIGAGSNHVDGGVYKIIKDTGELTTLGNEFFDFFRQPKEAPVALPNNTGVRHGTSPVDEFNGSLQGVEEVRKALEQKGYVFTRKSDHYTYVRPGKSDFTYSISGTLGHKNTRGNYFIKNFSTSDAIFGPESYNVSEAYRLINNWEQSDLPKRLQDAGFGDKPEVLDWRNDPMFAAFHRVMNSEGKMVKPSQIKATGEEIEKSYPTRTWKQIREATNNGTRRPYVIEGLLRRGEVQNLIASPKVGKSWLVYNMAFAVSCGKKFLGYQAAENLSVLIVDNELHEEELAWRTTQVGEKLGVDPEERLQFTCLRGSDVDIDALDKKLDEVGGSRFDIIVIDAFYRILPKGMSENDNSSMTQIYNKLDTLARKNECAIVCIHHSSKGNQSEKSVTDVGSGAGAISRAADTHMIIRPHAQDGLFVVDAVTRSGISPPAVTCKLEWPIWEVVSDVEPELKTFENARNANNVKAQEEAEAKDNLIIEFFDCEPKSSTLAWEALKMSIGGAEKTLKNKLTKFASDGLIKEVLVAGSRSKCYIGIDC